MGNLTKNINEKNSFKKILRKKNGNWLKNKR